MELNVSFPSGSGVKPKLVSFSKQPQTVRDVISELVSTNPKLGTEDLFVIYVPARPAQKAKSSWNEADTPFASLNLQPKDFVHLKKKVILAKVTLVTKEGKRKIVTSFNVTKPVSWNLQLLSQKIKIPFATIQSSYVLSLLGGANNTFSFDAPFIQQDLPGDIATFLLKHKEATYEPDVPEVAMPVVAVDINGPASKIKDPQAAGYLQLYSAKKKKFEKFWFVVKDKWLLCYKSPDAPKPESSTPLQTFLFQLGDKDKTSKDKNKQLTIELRVDEGAKGLNLYVLKVDDDASLKKWSGVFEDLLAGAVGGKSGAKRTLKKGAYFGVPLEDTVSVTDGSEIPDLLEQGFKFIEAKDLKTEGIFRLSGSANLITEYKRRFDAGEIVDFMKETDPHAVTGIIKLFLRELPEPLLTFDLYALFIAMDSCKEKVMRLRFTRYLISRLPPLNRATLKRLMGFLFKVSQFSSVNKMALHNLATVFGPNLLGTRDKNIIQMVENTAQTNSITNYLIQEYTAIFETENPPPPTNETVIATAIYDYAGDSDVDLAFQAHQVLFIACQMKDGWWWGELDGKFGRLPGTYVTPMSPAEAAEYLKTHCDLSKEEAAVVQLTKQKTELLQQIDQLNHERESAEQNSQEAYSKLSEAKTLAVKLVELKKKIDDFKSQQSTYKESKHHVMHELEVFSSALACAVTPATQKAKPPTKKDSKAALEDPSVGQLQAAIGAIWNKFIAEEMNRKKLLENEDDLLTAIADMEALLSALRK